MILANRKNYGCIFFVIWATCFGIIFVANVAVAAAVCFRRIKIIISFDSFSGMQHLKIFIFIFIQVATPEGNTWNFNVFSSRSTSYVATTRSHRSQPLIASIFLCSICLYHSFALIYRLPKISIYLKYFRIWNGCSEPRVENGNVNALSLYVSFWCKIDSTLFGYQIVFINFDVHCHKWRWVPIHYLLPNAFSKYQSLFLSVCVFALQVRRRYLCCF